MGFKFRKRIKIAPGINLNLSKSGVSTSIGKSGATVNIGKKGTTATVGAPGTGFSYSKKLNSSKSDKGDQEMESNQPRYNNISKPDKPLTSRFIFWVGVFFFPFIFVWFTLKKGTPTKHKVIAFGWFIIMLVVGYTQNHDKKVTSQPKEVVQTIEKAPQQQLEEQLTEALKDPRKRRLMECHGINPWKTKPDNWTPPTKEECAKIDKILGEEAKARKQE
ncbi:MAG: DUF4236 domain-containing protein [Vibrio sp.]